MSVSQAVRRAMLYVPASSQKMLSKSLGLRVDCAVYDLEDSVAPHQKSESRIALTEFLTNSRPHGVREVAVRINGPGTSHALDDLLSILKAPAVNTIVVPMVQSTADLGFVTDVVKHVRGTSNGHTSPKIFALIETAKALVNVNEICQADPLLDGIAFAAEDFCHDLSITRTPALTELLFARSSIVTAARAHGIRSVVDLVTTRFKGESGLAALREECESGKRLGFNGKQLIHPAQIQVAEEAFGVAPEDLEWAVRVTTADAKASRHGRGSWTLDGEMVDIPVVKRAQVILDRAFAYEMDVVSVRERWKHQEPE